MRHATPKTATRKPPRGEDTLPAYLTTGAPRDALTLLRVMVCVAAIIPVARIASSQGPLAPATADTTSATSALFPFILPWDDATSGVIDLGGWLPKPAGEFGHVRAGKDGHLYAGKERVRFFGVDLAFSANFPAHADADKIAARMAKFGINIVRFHIMDMSRFPEGILARNGTSTRDLDPEALDRLDYFADQLSRRGIYIYLCLLNYRPINAADGLPPEIDQAGGAPYQARHVVGFFDRQVLDLQKEYARKLLTHRNAYTGRTYTEDPAVAFVEINNENGLIHAWLGGTIDTLPALYRAELARKWNQWLRERHGTTQRLRDAWSAGAAAPLSELLANGDFRRDLEGWYFERHDAAEANATATADVPDALPGAKSVRIAVTKPGTESWHVRFEQAGFRVQADTLCAFTFWGKSDKATTAHVSIEQTTAPWHMLSTRKDVLLTTEWKQFRVLLPIGESDEKARVVFDPAMEPGTCWLAGMSLRTAHSPGLGEGEGPENDSVPLFTASQLAERTPAAQRDWIRFLWDTEDRYWQAMYACLKDELQVRSLVIGTVVGCSTPNIMAGMDCVDAHAYWQHPVFPGRPWDPENWYVQNQTMVIDRGGVLPGLALRRVLGKPFAVTEYGHAAPNTFVSEAHPLRAAYASLQDWDYISASRYSHRDDWDLRRIRNHFDIDQHPTKMATMIPAAAMFLRGDVAPAHQLVVASLDKDREIDLLRHAHAWDLVNAGSVGVPNEASLIHRVAIATGGTSAPAGALSPGEAAVTGNRFVSDTGQLDWDLREAGRGVVTIDTQKSKAVIGYGAGKRFDLGGVFIEPGETMQKGWSAVTVTAMEGDFAKAPCRVLVTATGYAENSRMGWKNAEKSTVGKDWGEAPSLVEGIPAKITLPVPAQAVTAWALDERGQRKDQLPVTPDGNGNAVVAIGPQWRTIWYEVAAERPARGARQQE